MKMLVHAERRPTAISTVLLFLSLAVISTGCTVRLIGEHDPVLDEETTRLHAQVETFLSRMQGRAGTDDGTFARNRDFYEEVQGRLHALRARTEVAPKSELLVQHLDDIAANIADLQQLHEIGGSEGLDEPTVQPVRTLLATQFRALLKLNHELRRGAKD